MTKKLIRHATLNSQFAIKYMATNFALRLNGGENLLHRIHHPPGRTTIDIL
jgi:hypothetical protein